LVCLVVGMHTSAWSEGSVSTGLTWDSWTQAPASNDAGMAVFSGAELEVNNMIEENVLSHFMESDDFKAVQVSGCVGAWGKASPNARRASTVLGPRCGG
jgi:hypothetical protein